MCWLRISFLCGKMLSWNVSLYVIGIAGNGKGKVPACLGSMFSISHCKETAKLLHKKFFMLPLPEAAG